MERNSPSEIIPVVLNALRIGEQTLNQLSKSSKINRVTLSQYISAFEKAGVLKTKKLGRERHIQLRNNPDSYFDLPIKEEDNKKLSTIYSYIKETCLKLYNKEPTKTQVYKILWELNKERNFPIGWYQHGPCAVRIYRGTEHKHQELDKDEKELIKRKVEEYCKLTSEELQKKVYSKENNELYLLKEKLITKPEIEKDELNGLLMDLIKLTPKETISTVSDFVRTSLLLGWEKSKFLFTEHVWKYISLVVFKESLRDYYGDSIDLHLQEKINEIKIESNRIIENLVIDYTNSKHSQDKLYRRWVKKR
ncbi:helix-turn-helix transcriptional regulator [Candidatus Woesearchaeota archaeon]|nr:helix-turn-helix transcriptional regulator [Candidatus Woesearchaeota archaeon]